MNRKHLTISNAPEPECRHDPDLEQSLRRQMLALSFHGFEICVSHTLRALGYEDVQVRRTGRDGRNRDGGWDIEAMIPVGLSSMKAITQVKQYDVVPVQKRYVDELRGSMLRSGAHQGILITLSTFPGTARDAVAGGAIAPVRLIDGEELAQLMIARGIGVTKDSRGRHKVDLEYFERLRHFDSEVLDSPSCDTSEGTSAPRGATSVTVVVVAGGRSWRAEWKDKR